MSLLARTLLVGTGAAFVLTLTPVAPAQACSGSSCAPSAFLPETGSLPSNAVEFLWRPAWGAPISSAPKAQLYKLESGQRSKLEMQIVDGPGGLKRVRPVQALAAGTVLVLESEEPVCTTATQVAAQVTLGEASAKPSQLGTLRVVETLGSTTLHIPTSSGSCSDDFAVASARLALSLHSSAQPFAAAMQHALVVDGKTRPQPAPVPPRGSWPSFALTRKLEDVLYTLCAKPSDGWTNDIPAGSHRVQWLSTLPDGTELRSDELTIQLQCSASGDAGVAADAGAGTSDASLRADAGAQADPQPPSNELPVQTDAAAPDAASASDTGAAASQTNSTTTDEADGGGDASCALGSPAGRAGGGTWAWLAGLALAIALARRRSAARA